MTKKATSAPAKSVDDYLADLPEQVQITLEKVRKAIKAAVPGIEEVISYRIPTYKLNVALVAFAAFKDHLSFITMSYAVVEELKEDLKNYKTTGTTIHFPLDKPLPAALIKKLLIARISEVDALPKKKTASKKVAAKKTIAARKTSAAKKTSSKLSDDEQVKEYMNQLKHPLKKEMEAVRVIIKNANKNISERIKWNAPSYYYKEDLVTFNHRTDKHVHLVFHHPSIVKIKSDLLEGDYKDRRMAYFKDMKAVKDNKKELERIINELVKKVDGK